MAFVARDWRDYPDTSTPITAAALESLETRVTDYADSLTTNTQTVNYTLVLGDASACVEMNSASARTITVPPNSSVAFPVGTVIELHRYSTGSVTAVAGAGVTIRSPGSLLALANQYSSASLRKRATNEWVLGGDLA